MEVLALNSFSAAYRGRKVMVTGHTGFKGSWLCLWLDALGAELTGVALDPSSSPNHWDLLGLPVKDHRIDIRDEAAVYSIVEANPPEIIFHLAAQPLVRHSYTEPIATWSTNVMGTAHVLEAARRTPGVRAVVVVTTDKCYENREWPWAYRERDRLGGHDPYSASKAGAELVAASYRSAFMQEPGSPLIATARGGNVIGGGDWSADRLIPDVARSAAAGKPLVVRSPNATRPWQHVLDCLSGYLLLGQRLLAGDSACADSWNFGPDGRGNRTVQDVLEELSRTWSQARWEITSDPQPHEAALLQLDCAKARMLLGWSPVWDFDTAIQNTARWYRQWLRAGEALSSNQLSAYLSDAADAGMEWARL